MAGRAGRPVIGLSAFWDTSALVPLCVRQPATPRVISAYKRYKVVIWWATPVEIASALARLMRVNQLDADDWAKARRLVKSLADSWSVVQPSDAIRRRAAELVDGYDLRAADSLQLAAALQWCESQPRGRIFLTLDHKLREAALLSGFDVKII